MDEQHEPTATAPRDVADVIEIRDPEIDVEALMARVRANVARRRAEGAYQEDLDAIAREVFAQVVSAEQGAAAPPPGASPLAQTLSELHTRWMIREQPFASNAPVVGPLIVRVRDAWNWMSTKWYVRALLQQIVGFNSLVVRAFQETEQAQEHLAQRVAHLEQANEAQAREIEALRQELSVLRGLANGTGAAGKRAER